MYDDFYGRIYCELIDSLEQGRGGPFAAAVIKGDRLLSIGTNTVIETCDVSRHAEINTIAKAGRAMQSPHLVDTILLATHFPCLMCYHAIKWAKIERVVFVFDYDETETLFGIRGDNIFLHDLEIPCQTLEHAPGLKLQRYESSLTRELYRGKLFELWNSKYRDKCSSYDL